MYGPQSYISMISDAVRRRAYTEALQAVVRPGAVVVDIGTGPGWAAVVACKLGAARIYAIEPNPVIQAARLLAEANNCAAQITFLQGFSDNIDLPEKVDVIVSDMRGVLPL